MYFSEHAGRVIMIVRGRSLGEKMSQYLVDRLESLPNMVIRLHSRSPNVTATERLEAITVAICTTNAPNRSAAPYLFVFLGAAPHTEWLPASSRSTSTGSCSRAPISSREHLENWPLERPPFLLEANVPGMFAAGDARHESVKRVASAVGEGSVAVHFMHRYLAEL